VTDQGSDRALLDALALLLVRDLEAARREVAAYADDAQPWRLLPGLPNSGGTLVLHMAGNLRHFIGAVLGGSGYVRDRDAEFAARDLPRSALDAVLAATIGELQHALAGLDPARLDAPLPVAVRGAHPETRTFLLHLGVHLAYHLGQLDAHRRAVTGDATGVDAMALGPLLG
jgi:hypothetical protein